MTGERDNTEQWDSCADGEISGMLRRVHQRRRRVFALRMSAAAMVAVAFGVLFVEFRPEGTAAAGAISCREVKRVAKDFLANRLSPEQKGRVSAHLSDCPHCAEFMRKMRDKPDGGSRLEQGTTKVAARKPAKRLAEELLAGR